MSSFYNESQSEEADEEQIALNAMQMHKAQNYPSPTSPIDDTVPEQRFQKVRAGLINQEIRDLVFEFFIVLFILSFVIVILIVDKVYHAQCGIPIREWIIGLAVIYILWRMFELMKIAVLKRCYQDKSCWSLTIFAIGGATLIAWLILGSYWFYSEDNNCDQQHDTLVIYYLMLVLLILGYIFILLYLLALVILPCVYAQSQSEDQENT